MSTDISKALRTLLARSCGPYSAAADRDVPPDYGVEATLDGGLIIATLTFRSERAYCCMEWGCHLALFGTPRWDSLRELIEAGARERPSQIELRLTVIVETGSVFYDYSRSEPGHLGRFAFRRARAYSYEVETREVAEMIRHVRD